MKELVIILILQCIVSYSLLLPSPFIIRYPKNPFKCVTSIKSSKSNSIHLDDNNINDIDNDIDSNPPYFPSSTLDIAKDTAYSIKLGLIEQLSRMRVDIRTRTTYRYRHMIQWLIHTSYLLFDEYIDTVCIFVNDLDDIERCSKSMNDLKSLQSTNDNHRQGKIEINLLSDQTMFYQNNYRDITSTQKQLKNPSSIYILHCPDNIFCEDNPYVLEHIEGICFQAAIDKIPIVIINPNLISTAWNDYGMTPPMLLSDFQQVYFIRDDYAMVSHNNCWCGFIYRITLGFDVFLIEIHHKVSNDFSYVRMNSWKDDFPQDFSTIISDILLNFSEFVQKRKNIILNDPMNQDPTIFINNPWNANISSFQDTVIANEKKFSWKSITPPSSSSSSS